MKSHIELRSQLRRHESWRVIVISMVAIEHRTHLCSLVLLVAVGTRPVSSDRPGLGALEAARLLQGRQAPGECALLLDARAGLGRRARLLPKGWWRRHLKHSILCQPRHIHGALIG